MRRRANSSAGSARAAMVLTVAAIFLLGCLPASAAQARRPSELTVRLPGSASEAHVPVGKSRPVDGHASLTVPSAWAHRRATNSSTVGHLSVTLSAQCQATIQVETWVGLLSEAPALEIERAMDFWFEVFAPVAPRAVPLVAHRASARRAWALSTPPPPPSEAPTSAGPPRAPQRSPSPQRSPYYGVVMQRLAHTDLWAAAFIGVKTTAACTSKLPQRASLQSSLETMLRTATFKARIG